MMIMKSMMMKVKAGVDKLANSKLYCKAMSALFMTMCMVASLCVPVSADGVAGSTTTVDPMTTGFENVITLFQKIWEICCSNALLATLLAACLVPVGTRAFRSVKKALK